VLKESRNLHSDGWFEIQDIGFPVCCEDGTLLPNCHLVRWCELMIEAAVKTGRSLDKHTQVKEMIENAGFVDVIQTCFKWPQNPWPKTRKEKELGMWVRENFVGGGLEAMSLRLLSRELGWTSQEIAVLLALVKKDIRDPKIHAYWPIYVVYGRKP
jgi:hypothetical protein